jgi:hypothetical protein
MQAAGYARLLVLFLMCICMPVCEAGARDRADGPILTKQQLIGAWRLVTIDLSGPNGPIVDPFYQADSEGIIVYDSSGWMSVQIATRHRQAFDVPALRSPSSATGEQSRRKAAAYDTYYSYFGTWDLDEMTGVVTHYVKSSLIPAETGLSYAQNVTLEGGRLTFTVRNRTHGKETVRRKVWERIAGIQ